MLKKLACILLVAIICIRNVWASPITIPDNYGYINVDGVRTYAQIDESANIRILICMALFLIFCMFDKKLKLKKLASNAIFIIIWCIEMILISDKLKLYEYAIPYYTIFLLCLSLVAGMVIFVKVIALFINIYRYKKGKEIEIEKYKKKMFKTVLIFSVPIMQILSFDFGRTGWGGTYKVGERIMGPEYNPTIDITLIAATLIPFVVIVICKRIFNFWQIKNNAIAMQSTDSEELNKRNLEN